NSMLTTAATTNPTGNAAQPLAPSTPPTLPASFTSPAPIVWGAVNRSTACNPPNTTVDTAARPATAPSAPVATVSVSARPSRTYAGSVSTSGNRRCVRSVSVNGTTSVATTNGISSSVTDAPRETNQPVTRAHTTAAPSSHERFGSRSAGRARRRAQRHNHPPQAPQVAPAITVHSMTVASSPHPRSTITWRHERYLRVTAVRSGPPRGAGPTTHVWF